MAGSSVIRVPFKSAEKSLTNSVCAGEDSGRPMVGGLGVVLELAAAFVDSAMTEICSMKRDSK